MKKYKVTERNSLNEIIREIKNLNIYEAEETFLKILNTNPVRQGHNSVKIIQQ